MTLRRRSTEQDELLGGGSRHQDLGTPPPRVRKRRGGPLIQPKKILRNFGYLCLLALGTYAGLAFLVNGERLRPKLETAFSSATGRRVEMRTLTFSLRRLALTATDLTVDEDPAFGGHVPFVQAASAQFKVKLAALLFLHEAHVREVSIDSPVVMLRQNAAGAWNYYSLLKASTKSITELDPPSIQVNDGRLSITGFGADAHSVRLREIRLRAPALSLQMSNPFTLTANVEGGGSVKLEGRAGPMQWDPTGPLVPLAGLVHAGNVNLSESNVLSSAPSVGGQLSLDASIESDGRMVQMDGQAKAVKLKLAAAGSPATQPLEAVFTLTHDLNTHAGVLNRCDFRVNKGTATLAGKYASTGQSTLLNLDLAISDAPVTDLGPLLPALGFPLPGSAEMSGGAAVAKLKLDGALDGPYVTGSLAVNGARLTGFDLSRRLSSVEGLNATGLETEFEIVSWKSDLKTGAAGLNLENLEVAVAGLGLLRGNGSIAPDSRLDFRMSGIRGLTGPKGTAIPFTVHGACADPVFQPGK